MKAKNNAITIRKPQSKTSPNVELFIETVISFLTRRQSDLEIVDGSIKMKNGHPKHQTNEKVPAL